MQPRMQPSVVLALALLASAAGSRAAAQSPVLVVDAQGVPGQQGVDFVEIADAVAAASGGETILVRSGHYLPFRIDGRSLVLTADAGAQVVIDGGLRIQGLAADQAVVVRGLQSAPMEDGTHAALVVQCAGLAWFEDCELRAGGASAGLFLEGVDAAIVARCSLVAGDGFVVASSFGTPGGAGIVVNSAQLALWDSDGFGGDGGSHPAIAGLGGAGLFLGDAASLRMSGGSLTGGKGGDSGKTFDPSSGQILCNLPGYGGAGLDLTWISEEGASVAELIDVALAGGAGGLNTDPSCVDAEAGPPLAGDPSLATLLAGPPRGLQLDSPVREGALQHLLISGAAGDGVLVLASLQPAFTSMPVGTLALGPVLPLVVALSLPAGGELTLAFQVPELGPGIESLQIAAQGLFVPGVGAKRLGAPSAAVLLDDSF
jgi:hypothetical protein